MDYLPYGKQWIDQDDVDAVVEVLNSNWLTTGPKVKEFEEKLAEKVSAKYVVAVNSGTSALHAAYFAAGVGRGDEVITSPITFAATANAASYLGGKPVFVDVEKNSINIDPHKIEEKITPSTKVLAPVDFAGQPADLDAVREIAAKHRLVVVEDAAHALGAKYKGQPVGSLADMTIFSFHPVKLITTGEGGAVATNNQEFYKKLLSFRTHGITREKTKLVEDHGPWHQEMQLLGYNYRITDLQCALGISQLGKLDAFLKKRKEIARFYQENLQNIKHIELPSLISEGDHAWHLYTIRLKGDKPPRREVFEALHKRGIGVQVHYLPVYWHPYYMEKGYGKGLCPLAEDYYRSCLSLPVFPAMEAKDMERVVTELKSVIREVYQ